MAQQAQTRLHALIEPIITNLNLEFVGLEYMAQGQQMLLRVYIDSPKGITVDDCGLVSYRLSGMLEVEDPIQANYTLEVSSPGLDRPLFTPAHYEQFSGERVNIRLMMPLDGRRNFKGLLKGLDEDSVVVEVDGENFYLPFHNIDKAKLIPNFKISK